MKKFSKILILGILVGSFTFPLLAVAVPKTAQAEERRFKLGITGTPAEDWDIAITGGYNIVDLWYRDAATEYLAGLPDSYDRGLSQGVYKAETWKPVLATSWDWDFWPEETNSIGFKNRGGVANITYTLRENVTFHDGSEWNATVAKWNIDRVYIITGNLSGNGDLRNRDIYWSKVADWEDYFTPSWNLSQYIGTFGWYDTWFNPDPFNGGILRAPYEMYPIVKRVVVVDNGTSLGGGQIRIEFNDWNSYGMSSVGLIKYISMETYSDFFGTGIYGFDNDDPLYPDHLIGTGPYMYIDHDETAEPGGGSMQKNPNFWNRTALEDEGWFDADYIDILTWDSGEAGTESRNTALMTNAIDYALDNFFTPVDYNDVMSNSRINYIERPNSDYVSAITLNTIDSSNWLSWGIMNTSVSYPTTYNGGDNDAAGVPRVLRKAMSYAFDYDSYINVGLNGCADRGSSMGITNLYYNDAIPIAYHNLTIAREALLNDPVFGPLAVAEGLTGTSTDTDWQNVANGVGGATPLYILDFYWDDNFQVMKNVFQTSLADIGVALKDTSGATNKLSTNMWAEVGTYWLTGFPVFSAQAWPLDWNIPRTIPEGWISAYYWDPNGGRWRPPYYDFGLGFDYFPWFNLAFTYDTKTDDWLDRMWMSNDTTRGVWMDAIANWSQNYQYPWIFVSQGKQGSVHWNDWELSTYWGNIAYTLLRYVGFTEAPIPGFSVGIGLGVTALSVLSVIYVVMRKKKTH